MTPRAAVIIPCFNHGPFVGDAVRSALAQTDAEVRVVVVDDGSTDGSSPATCDAVAADHVRVLHQPNAGPAVARNRGAREAAAWFPSEYLVFLDADDTIEPGFVRTLAAALAAAPDSDRASHAYCQEVLTGMGTGVWHVPEWDPLMVLITNLHPVTTLVRRRCFEAVGGFDCTIPGYEDWDLWIKMAERGWRGVRVREPLFVWRRHSAVTRINADVARHDEIFRAILTRHRGLYDRHAADLIARSNSMLRTFDMNWLDETGYPKPLQYLWYVRDQLAPELGRQAELARAEVARLQAELAQVRAELAAAVTPQRTPIAGRLRRALRRLIPSGTGA